jgi:hypothetical protein
VGSNPTPSASEAANFVLQQAIVAKSLGGCLVVLIGKAAATRLLDDHERVLGRLMATVAAGRKRTIGLNESGFVPGFDRSFQLG